MGFFAGMIQEGLDGEVGFRVLQGEVLGIPDGLPEFRYYWQMYGDIRGRQEGDTGGCLGGI